jgi:hypothetical protein
LAFIGWAHGLRKQAWMVCLIVAAPVAAQLSGITFTATGNDTVPRYFHSASTLPDGVVMVTGGLGLNIIPPSLFSRNQVSFYILSTGAFAATYASLNGGPAVGVVLGQARSSHTQTSLHDGRVLITGGNVNASGTNPGASTATVELFNPWTGIMAPGPAMSEARAYHTATELPDGRVLIAGGSTWQLFDPTTTAWSTPHALARTRSGHAAVLLHDFGNLAYDDRVLIVGGAGTGAATMELIDPASASAELLVSTLSVGVDDLAATRLPGGRVLVVGGQNVASGDTVSNAYLVDVEADAIAAVASPPNRAGGISDHQLVRFGAYVYVLGGEQQTGGADTELNYAAAFDGVSESWAGDGTMQFVHDDFAAAPLGSCGVLLIDGGVPLLGNEAPSNRAEILSATIANACLSADFDNDGEVDHRDYDAVADCLTGPKPASAPAFIPFRCRAANFDVDGDIDLADFAEFQRHIGPRP